MLLLYNQYQPTNNQYQPTGEQDLELIPKYSLLLPLDTDLRTL